MIFVDTSFWIALRNGRDQNHKLAVTLLEQYGDEQLICTNHVYGETWTYLRRRAGHHAAVDFFDSIKRSKRIEISHLSEQSEAQAISWLKQHDEREYSFVDATSFIFMKSKKINRALAFDGDFSAAGFVELRS